MEFYCIDDQLNVVKLGHFDNLFHAKDHAENAGLKGLPISIEDMRVLSRRLETELGNTGRLQILPPGRYFVGDPCYAVPNDDWDEVLQATAYFGMFDWDSFHSGKRKYLSKTEADTMFSYKGYPMGASSTAHGDGLYEDQYGIQYPVDAGLIGVVHMDYAGKSQDLEGSGRIVEFKDFFTISYEEDEGTIVIGELRIKTDPDEEPCFYCGETYCDEECRNDDQD